MSSLKFALADKVATNYDNYITDMAISKFNEECSRRVEYILRNLITNPIKGEITKRKLRARQIELVYLNDTNVTNALLPEGGMRVNISQTAYVIEKGGKKYYLF